MLHCHEIVDSTFVKKKKNLTQIIDIPRHDALDCTKIGSETKVSTDFSIIFQNDKQR